MNPRSVLDNLTDRVKHYEEPAYGLGANYTISKLAKNNNVTVVLNGLGGDELLLVMRIIDMQAERVLGGSVHLPV